MSEETMFNEAMDKVQEIMFEIVSLLNSFGITDVRAGAVMRLLGTSEEEAAPFDDKVMIVKGDVIDLIEVDEIAEEHPIDESPDPGTTLH
jgi:hypothetical protein